jgi:hypothetical protein
MSETILATIEPSHLPFIIMTIITSHTHTFNTLTTTSTESLDYSIYSMSYENAINLAYALYSSKNLTDQFTALLTKTEDLILEYDATLANRNTLTAPRSRDSRPSSRKPLPLLLLLQTYCLLAARDRLTPRSSLGSTVAS